jgi:hypothetical protein
MTTSPHDRDPRTLPGPAGAFSSDLGLLLRSPDSLIAALPYLLGFKPRESVVLVWLGQARILLTQRMDLPLADADPTPWLDAVWAHSAAPNADELIVVMVTCRSDAEDFADLVVEEAVERGVHVRDAIRLDDSRWWSYLCADDACCGPAGRAIDEGVRSAVAAEFALMGSAPVADREDLVAAMSADPEGTSAVDGLVTAILGAVRRGQGLESWRDQSIDVALAAIERAARRDRPFDMPGVEETAAVIAGLTDVRVRDTVLWEVSRADRGERAAALDVLQAALRCAPPGSVAPIASCCSLVAWLNGDGARAVVAVERALRDDPAYSLAGLLAQSLAAGLPPQAWMDATVGLTRHDCRHGEAGAMRLRARVS